MRSIQKRQRLNKINPVNKTENPPDRLNLSGGFFAFAHG